MKKILLYLIILSLLLSFVGCAPAYSSSPTDPKVLDKTHTDVPGMTIEIDKISAENGLVRLDVIWSNQTEDTVVYGEVHSIDRLEGDEWVSCAMRENTAFTTVAYMLNPGSEIKRGYTISYLFDVSAPGTYRFKTNCTVGKQSCELWAEFSIAQPQIPDGSTPISFIAKPVRTNGYSDSIKYPAVVVISSLQQLNDYYSAHKEVFDLERKEIYFPGPSELGFLNLYDQYDEAFFEENYLIFTILEEGSGSIRHNVESVALTSDGKLSVFIRSIVPEVCTDDMAEWHIILELQRSTAIESEKDVVVYWDGRLAWDGEYVAPPKPEADYKEPPEMLVVTPEGEAVIKAAGYNWTYDNTDGTSTSVIADQAGRPLSKDVLEAITIDQKYAETVYAYAKPGQYEPTNMLGYMVKLHFDVCPSSLSYTCWSSADNSPEETVEYFRDSQAFYAKGGSYIYEIAATWKDTGAGYSGTAYYYVYIVGGHHAVPIICD